MNSGHNESKKSMEEYAEFLSRNNSKLDDILMQYDTTLETKTYSDKITNYIGIIMSTLLILITIAYYNGRQVFTSIESESQQNVQVLQNKIDSLESKMQQILTSSSTISNSKVDTLSIEISEIKKQNSYINEIILNTPEKVVTAKFLRDEQMRAADEIKIMKSDFRELQFYVIGFFGTIIIGLLGFIGSRYLIEGNYLKVTDKNKKIKK